jgi:hypothetical protein
LPIDATLRFAEADFSEHGSSEANLAGHHPNVLQLLQIG